MGSLTGALVFGGGTVVVLLAVIGYALWSAKQRGAMEGSKDVTDAENDALRSYADRMAKTPPTGDALLRLARRRLQGDRDDS